MTASIDIFSVSVDRPNGAVFRPETAYESSLSYERGSAKRRDEASKRVIETSSCPLKEGSCTKK